MTLDRATDDPETAGLRDALLARLRERGAVRSEPVAAAFASVPRHVFAPEVPPAEAYADDVVVTKRAADGRATSSVSAPWLQAEMLERSDIARGMSVLEIGSGGYNAALLAEIVGPEGAVTTVDIDADVVERARRFLPEAGDRTVNVVQGDAERGVPAGAPYDRILVTVGAWDIPPAWTEQLVDGGMLTVPLVLNGLSRCVVFQRQGSVLVSRSLLTCGFVAMQGAGAPGPRRSVALHGDEIHLQPTDERDLDAGRLRASLHEPRTERWTGAVVGGYEPFDGLDLWLNTCFPDMCVLTRTFEAGRDLVDPTYFPGTPALVNDDGGWAYHALRRTERGDPAYEFGVYGHGPGSAELADAMAERIRQWDREHRADRAAPRIEAHPAGVPTTYLPAGLVVDTAHRRMVIGWPDTDGR